MGIGGISGYYDDYGHSSNAECNAERFTRTNTFDLSRSEIVNLSRD